MPLDPSVREVYPFAFRTCLDPVFKLVLGLPIHDEHVTVGKPLGPTNTPVPIGVPSRTWARDRCAWGCKTLSLRGGSGLFPQASLPHPWRTTGSSGERTPARYQRAEAMPFHCYPGCVHYRHKCIRKSSGMGQLPRQCRHPGNTAGPPNLHLSGIVSLDQASQSPTPGSDSGCALPPQRSTRNQEVGWKRDFQGG